MQSLADSSAAGPLTEILSVGGKHGVNPWQFPLLLVFQEDKSECLFAYCHIGSACGGRAAGASVRSV